jgi:hypothetical protein
MTPEDYERWEMSYREACKRDFERKIYQDCKDEENNMRTMDGTILQQLHKHVDNATEKRAYVLQNSRGRVCEIEALMLAHVEAERRNDKLASLNSDYRWVRV